MSRAYELTVTAKDIPGVRDLIEAAAEVVSWHESFGLHDERVGGAILSLESALDALAPDHTTNHNQEGTR